ncbi:cobalamin biosynthesis protein [Aeromicrobium fastidiosum]|uniref:Cobalamin biosynthesis protein CobD n=1 Tax=Aeromicrobium fastidiosum TaxID=52699 RepID=A0A641AR83_9ACTN|nr:cobalamin biosynthesis protein [Aeromicrobium fastidiosum]KAA1380027.1 cobalamin biosynthesis protein [Aeromicrobium fastidiosum]MBP2389550.1 adenosylcobinamide-phosphate synthase [Aeromicrobium fastidiosum]
MSARATGLVIGFAADRLLGDPARHHPVAGFGRLAGALEQRMWADDRLTGAAYTATLVGGAGAAGLLADRITRGRPIARSLLTAATTWAVLGGRSLGREAQRVHAHLDRDDLPAAREQLTHLVGRDPSQLDAAEISRATVESVAENTSDAVVAPLLAGAVGGIGGLMAYRAANTLDAMVGHRSERFERFGWASARLDDVLNLAPARLSALLGAALAPLVGGRPADAFEAWTRDARRHPSPNAGPVEASFAGALGVQLGGTNLYGTRVEHRALLGSGRPVSPDDVPRAVRLADAVGLGAAVVSASVAARPTRRRPRRR